MFIKNIISKYINLENKKSKINEIYFELMFGGLIVLNQRRSADEREPGPEQNFTKSLCEGAPKH